MKNMIKALAIIALAAVIGFTFIACDNGTTDGGGGGGGGGGGNPTSDPNTYTGYDSEGKQYQLAILKAASNPGTGGNTGTGTRDSRLVNAANDAWVDSYSAGSRDGFIFKEDGTFQFIDDYSGATEGVFAVYGAAGTWSTSGNNSLTIRVSTSDSETYSYTVTGTTLTLTDEDGDSEVYTKTQVTVSGRSAASPAPAGNTGTKAVAGAIKRAAAVGLTANRAAAKGDKFTLTIKNAGGATVGTSTGTVDTISGNGETLTLDKDGAKFTAKIKGQAIAELPDPVPLDDGGTLPRPGTLYANNPNNTGPGVDSNWKWTAVEDSTFSLYEFLAVAYGNNRFVASFNRMIAYSDNGASWTHVVNSKFVNPSYINGVAYGNGRFVAVGSNGQMSYSDDNGASWTEVEDSTIWEYTNSSDVTLKASINAIAYGNNRFVAGGGQGKMAYSDDGINWTAVADSTFPAAVTGGSSTVSITFSCSISGIAYGNNKFVAVGSDSRMAYSDDGINWTAVADSTFPAMVVVPGSYATPYSISVIAYGNNRFVAVGEEGKMAYSANGINWTAVADSTIWRNKYNDTVAIHAIAYGNNRFVAVGDQGKMAYSADGASWTAVADSTIWQSTYTTYSINAIAYGNNRFVAMGGNGKIAYADW